MARSPTAWDYTQAIRSGPWHEAKQLLSDLEVKALEPQVISFNAALSVSRWQDAMPMLRWMDGRRRASDSSCLAVSLAAISLLDASELQANWMKITTSSTFFDAFRGASSPTSSP